MKYDFAQEEKKLNKLLKRLGEPAKVLEYLDSITCTCRKELQYPNIYGKCYDCQEVLFTKFAIRQAKKGVFFV